MSKLKLALSGLNLQQKRQTHNVVLQNKNAMPAANRGTKGWLLAFHPVRLPRTCVIPSWARNAATADDRELILPLLPDAAAAALVWPLPGQLQSAQHVLSPAAPVAQPAAPELKAAAAAAQQADLDSGSAAAVMTANAPAALADCHEGGRPRPGCNNTSTAMPGLKMRQASARSVG